MNMRGFSIAEVLVAMFILLVGIIDVIYLTGRGVTETNDSTRAVIGTMLAQEGAELMRNVRDNNVTRTDCGNGGRSRCKAFEQLFPSINHSVSAGYCTVDWEFSGNPMKCSGASGGNSGAIFLNADTGLYSHVQGANTMATPFSRRVYVEYAMSDGSPADATSLSGDQLIANITSVVMFGKMTFEEIGAIENVESWCKIGQGCSFAQTRLTSWLNYD